MRLPRITLAALVFALVATGTMAQTPVRRPDNSLATLNASVTQGRLVYVRVCEQCHIEGRLNGGTLRGVYNAGAGQRRGVPVTSALKYSGKIWNEAQLDQFLADPMRDIPGTTMVGGKLPDANDRRNVIAYLMTLQ